MRWLGLSVISLLAACGSSQGEPVDDNVADASQTGGSANPQGSGGAGAAGHDAGTGGAGGRRDGGGAGTGVGGSVGAGGGPGAGGSAGSAGDAGAGGGNPQTVGKCDGLGASGTWEYIWPVAPPRTGSQAGDSTGLVADPFDAGTVWNAAFQKGLYKSTDCGGTWAHVNTGRNGSSVDQGSLVSMAVDPVDKGVIYVTPIYGAGGVWKSVNGGVDWDQIVTQDVGQYIPGLAFDSVSMDRNDNRHLVMGLHTNCTGPYAPACVVETTDAGATWTIVKLPTGGWEEGAGPWVVDATTWLFGGLHLWLTTDRGASWQNLDPDPAVFWGFSGGEVENHSIPRAADGTYFLTCNQGVVRSSDGRSWSLIPNSGGRAVGFAMGGGHLFTSDQWSSTYHTASESNPTTWTTLPPPTGLPSSQGAPYLSYDAAHHVLYSSNFAGGLWRVVTP